MNEYKIIVTNSHGESIDLWGDKEVALTSIDGVSIDADINTISLSGMDGSSFLHSRIPERTISMVIQYKIEALDAEKSKLRLYRIFRPKEEITLRYISPNQDKYIKGYVSKCNTPPTEYPMITQVVIKAPDPYWREYFDNRTLLCGSTPTFEFIKDKTELTNVEFSVTKTSLITSIMYDGDSEAGITATFSIQSPVKMLGIRSVTHNQMIKLYTDFLSGDILTICTIPKHKAVTLKRNSQLYDYFIKISPGSNFPMIYPGENILEVLIDGGTYASITVNCDYETLSGGI